MNRPIYPSTQVLVMVPGSPQPPVLDVLANVHAARCAGQLPAAATVQLGPNEAWFPVDQVLAHAGLIVRAPPTPIRSLLVGVLLVPPILAAIHAVIFEMAVPFLLLLWALGAGAAIAATSMSSLKTKTSKELFAALRGRPMLWRGTLATIAVCELLTLGMGSVRLVRRGHARAVLAEAQDCNFAVKWEALGAAERETLDDLEQGKAQARLSACERERQQKAAAAYAEQCKEAAARLSSRKLSPEDRAHIMKGSPVSDEAYLSGREAADLAQRIADHALTTDDLGGMGKLPCGPAMRGRYLEAAAVSTAAWTGLRYRSHLGEDVRAAFGVGAIPSVAGAPAGETQLSAAVQTAVAEKAEEAARKLGWISTTAAGNDAENLCILAREITGKSTRSCAALEARQKQLRAKEGAASAAADKAENDALMRCFRSCNLARSAGQFEADQELAQACNAKCGSDGMCLSECRAAGGGGSADACQARCISKYPNGVPPF